MRDSSRPRPKVLILHAYSPRNSGDGLLVELALASVKRALGDARVTIIASDAAAFADSRFAQWSALPGRAARHRALRQVGMLATGLLGAPRTVRSLAADADVILAVGGAYLRGGSMIESLKSWGAHFGQLSLAAQHGSKAIYLPQSIGPFHGLYQRAVTRRLSNMHRVYLRDDKSARELIDLGNVRRVPDMAILELARTERPTTTAGTLGRPVVVARNLHHSGTYFQLLDGLDASGGFDWAVQSEGGGNDDRPLTERYAPSAPTLASILATNAPRVVVSTRLHGSLASLIAGYPSIHLSYERKGQSAFTDLGIPEYCLPARSASPADVLQLVEQIEANQSAYWSRLDARRATLLALSDQLDSDLQSVAFQPNRLPEVFGA